MIFITTDHGRDEQTGKSHSGQTFRQRSTWMVTNHLHLNAYARNYRPAIVDIMPSIAWFMHITIPSPISREVDGLPLIGGISLAEVEVHPFGNKLYITWQVLEPNGKVKIRVATTHHCKTGGNDDYQLVAEVPLALEHATVDVVKLPASFYKLVVEGPSNNMTKWYVQPEMQK